MTDERVSFTEEGIKHFLDSLIIKQRELISYLGDNRKMKARAECYLGAYQNVRITLFGEELK